MSALKDRLWVAKYAPKNFSETIMPDYVKRKMNEYVSTKNVPNLLFSGPAGTGKTTSGMALMRELNVEYGDMMFVNASDINSIDAVRNIIKPFAMSMSSNSDLPIRFVFLDECLSEHEKIRVGTVDSWIATPLKDIKSNTIYPIVSVNMETGELENDTGSIISDKEDTLYEVLLDDGRTIVLNDKHPFLVESPTGGMQEKTISDGLNVGDCIVTFNPIKTSSKITSITNKGVGRVLNLTVDKNHTFITENGIPTHNCDHLSNQAQAALRNLMEASYNSARFILTANYPKRIIPALHSRVQTFVLEKPALEPILERVITILDSEHVTIENEDDLVELIKNNSHDIRKLIQLLEQNTSIEDGKSVLRVTQLQDVGGELFQEYFSLFKAGDGKALRNLIYHKFTDADTVEFWSAMLEDIIQNSEDYETVGSGIDNIIYYLNEGQKSAEIVVNRQLNILGFTLASLSIGD